MAAKINQSDRKPKAKSTDLKNIWKRAITQNSEWAEKVCCNLKYD